MQNQFTLDLVKTKSSLDNFTLDLVKTKSSVNNCALDLVFTKSSVDNFALDLVFTKSSVDSFALDLVFTKSRVIVSFTLFGFHQIKSKCNLHLPPSSSSHMSFELYCNFLLVRQNFIPHQPYPILFDNNLGASYVLLLLKPCALHACVYSETYALTPSKSDPHSVPSD